MKLLTIGFLLTSKLRKENIRLRLIISKGNSNISLDSIWIVKKYDILNFATSSIQYKIWAELDCAIPLYTTCHYATSNDLYNDVDGGENPYSIIKSILNNVGFKLYPDISIDENGNEIRNRYSPPSTSNKIHFITNHNMYAIDAVKFLLSKAVSTLDVSPPAYLIYNIKDNKGFITTRENLFRTSSIEAQPDSTKAYYSITEASLGKQYQMKDVRTDSIMSDKDAGGIENSKLFYNYGFYKYNHKNRIWENDRVSKISINDNLTKGSSGQTDNSVLIGSGAEDYELARNYQFPTIKHQKMYDVLKHLELFSSNIQFSVDGDLNLDVGQVINVKEVSDSGGKTEMFNGKWLIIKIRHSFRNKEYKTNIIYARTYYTKLS